MIEVSMSQKDASQFGLPLEVVREIENRWLAAEHKKRFPLTAEIGYRSIGHDFRLPYTLRKPPLKC